MTTTQPPVYMQEADVNTQQLGRLKFHTGHVVIEVHYTYGMPQGTISVIHISTLTYNASISMFKNVSPNHSCGFYGILITQIEYKANRWTKRLQPGSIGHELAPVDSLS